MRCVARCRLSSVSSDLGVSVPVRVCVYLMHDAVSRPVVSVRLTQLCRGRFYSVGECMLPLYYDLARVHGDTSERRGARTKSGDESAEVYEKTDRSITKNQVTREVYERCTEQCTKNSSSGHSTLLGSRNTVAPLLGCSGGPVTSGGDPAA